MATTLVMEILQNVWLCAADYNEVYMNRTLFILIAFNYLILTFKTKRSAKNTIYFMKSRFFKLCFHGNSTRLWKIKLLSPTGYIQIA